MQLHLISTQCYPVDCEWQPPKSLIDCQKNIEKEFNGTDYRCYELMAFEGLKPEEQKAIMEEVKERMKNKEVYEYPEDNEGPKSLQKKLKQTCGSGGRSRRRRGRRGSRKARSRPCRKTKRIIKAFKTDLANIFVLTTKVTCVKKDRNSNFRKRSETPSCQISTGCTEGRRASGRTEEQRPSSRMLMRMRSTTGQRM